MKLISKKTVIFSVATTLISLAAVAAGAYLYLPADCVLFR
jgi:hypothetical protein